MSRRARSARADQRRGASSSRLRGRAGMTLIEIMVVVAVMGLLVGSVALGVNAVPRARLRTSAARLASTFRYAYVHALTTGKTTRVAFRLGGSQLAVEHTDDTHTLARRRDRFGSGSAEDVEAAARRESQSISDPRPRVPPAMFQALPARQFNARPLENGVTFVRLYSQHDAEPREEGDGAVYFFSGGQAERAVVHLRNSRGEIFSVVLNPLTGRTEIFDRPVEPPTEEDNTRDDTEVDAREQAPREANR